MLAVEDEWVTRFRVEYGKRKKLIIGTCLDTEKCKNSFLTYRL